MSASILLLINLFETIWECSDLKHRAPLQFWCRHWPYNSHKCLFINSEVSGTLKVFFPSILWICMASFSFKVTSPSRRGTSASLQNYYRSSSHCFYLLCFIFVLTLQFISALTAAKSSFLWSMPTLSTVFTNWRSWSNFVDR